MIEQWETETGRKCKKLITDRGGNYISEDFKAWCAMKGIIQEYSMPRTPEDN